MSKINKEKEQKKQEISKRIYEAGMQLFDEKGYNNTTLVEIAALAGVSTRTLYKYYPCKEDILFNFSKDHVKKIKEFSQQLPKNMDIKEKILTVMVKDFFTISQSKHFKVHQKEKRGSLLASRYEEENMLYLEGIYRQLLEDELRNRNLNKEIDCKVAAVIIVGIYRQVTDRLLLMENQISYQTFKEGYKSCLDVLWSGIENNIFSREPEL